MYYGLEARAPFLDEHLWKFAGSLPYRVRLRGYRLEAVLLTLAARRIGRRVALRGKRGFGVPVGRWIARGWRGFAVTALKDSRLVSNGLICPEPIRALFEDADARTAGAAWSLLVLESWLAHEEESGSRLAVPDRARFAASAGGA